MKHLSIIALISFLGLLTACDFEYHVNEVHKSMLPSNLNGNNLLRLQQQKASDTLILAFISDTQGFYDDTRDMVAHLNTQSDLDLIIHLGDITNFGIQEEYLWMNDILSQLKTPLLVIAGNHDLLANGELIYEYMYGPTSFTFSWGNNRFIMVNTNSIEYGFDGTVPNMHWLTDQLADTLAQRLILCMHVGPYDEDFDPAMRDTFLSVINQSPQLAIVVNAHRHYFQDFSSLHPNTCFLQNACANTREYLKITLTGQHCTYERVVF